MDQLVRHIEAVLFAASDYVSCDRLVQLTESSEKNVLNVIDKLKQKYENDDDSSMQIVQRGRAWKFSLKNQYMSKVHDLIQTTELSKAVMETLAIIAWRAPIMQADLIKIRSTKAYDHVAELVEFGFITKERSGRSYIVKLTQKFYEYFDISSQKEVQEIFEDIGQKPMAAQAFPQKKVVDFDGTPRKSAQLKEPIATLEVYDVEEERIRKQETSNAIKDMRSNHISYLEQLDDKLHGKQEERDELVNSLKRHKPDEEIKEDDNTQRQETHSNGDVEDTYSDEQEQQISETDQAVNEAIAASDEKIEATDVTATENIPSTLEELPPVPSPEEEKKKSLRSDSLEGNL